MNNKPFFLALNRIPKIGPRLLVKLLERWPSLKDMFALSAKDLRDAGLSESIAEAIVQFNWAEVDRDLDWEQGENHYLLSWEDSDYPQILKEIHDPPIVLYASGNLQAFQQTMLAMVGTRKPSPLGAETAWHFAKELAAYPISIVSGLAYGIDAKAHAGCLAAKGRTIAVMGTGMDEIYPREHRNLTRKILENGLVLTEFPLKKPANAGHFPRRNRIISGLSSLTLVVEAARKSGSLITARLALEQNRDVLAIPGSIHNLQARGCHYLLQQGAKLVSSVQDVLDELGLEKQSQGLESQARDSDCFKLLNYIDFEMTSIDNMIQRSGFKMAQIVSELAQLELKGIVKAVPGGYSRCIKSVTYPI